MVNTCNGSREGDSDNNAKFVGASGGFYVENYMTTHTHTHTHTYAKGVEAGNTRFGRHLYV